MEPTALLRLPQRVAGLRSLLHPLAWASLSLSFSLTHYLFPACYPSPPPPPPTHRSLTLTLSHSTHEFPACYPPHPHQSLTLTLTHSLHSLIHVFPACCPPALPEPGCRCGCRSRRGCICGFGCAGREVPALQRLPGEGNAEPRRSPPVVLCGGAAC